MPSGPDPDPRNQMRTYVRSKSIVFRKTKEEFGGLSNMAGGFALKVNGIRIRTAEALYQACRFPHMPDLQRLILEQRSPMTAKMMGKPHVRDSRDDWDHVRVPIMRWCLHVKLAQNWSKFSELLLATGDRPIVEDSRRDDFWGAVPVDGDTLFGMNVLGRLLMELREKVRDDPRSLMRIEPLPLAEFLLDGQQIGTVKANVADRQVAINVAEFDYKAIQHVQSTFFDGEFWDTSTMPTFQRYLLIVENPNCAIQKRLAELGDCAYRMSPSTFFVRSELSAYGFYTWLFGGQPGQLIVNPEVATVIELGDQVNGTNRIAFWEWLNGVDSPGFRISEEISIYGNSPDAPAVGGGGFEPEFVSGVSEVADAAARVLPWYWFVKDAGPRLVRWLRNIWPRR